MPYKSKRKQKAYADRWRQKHPNYMRDYYRNSVLPLVSTAQPAETLLDRIRQKNEAITAVAND